MAQQPSMRRSKFEALPPFEKAAAARTHQIIADPELAAGRAFDPDLWNRLSPASQDILRSQGAYPKGELDAPPPGFIKAPGGVGYIRADEV